MFDTISVFSFLVLLDMLPTGKTELGGSPRGERPSAVMDTTATDASGALPSRTDLESKVILRRVHCLKSDHKKKHTEILKL